MPSESKRQYTIFIVDTASGSRALSTALRSFGFKVAVCLNGDAAIRKALISPPSMFVVETDLPSEDGLALCKRIRTTSTLSLLPILIVSRRVHEADKVMGLEAGADDYITKPFGQRELVARVLASLRRCFELSQPSKFQFGDIELDAHAVTLTKKGSPIEMSLSEFRLLEYLVRNSGRTFGRDHLLKMIHSGSQDAKGRIVDVYVKRIRRKIEPDDKRPTYLRTVRGLGYCFHPS